MAKTCPMQGMSALDLWKQFGESIVSVKDNIAVGKALANSSILQPDATGVYSPPVPLHETRDGWIANYRYYFDGLAAKTRDNPVKRFFSALGDVAGQDIYTKIQGKVLGRIYEVDTLLKDIQRLFGNLNETQQKALTAFMRDEHMPKGRRRFTTRREDIGLLTGKVKIDQFIWTAEDQEQLSIFTEEQQALAREVKQKIMEVGQVAAELGVISKETWRANQGKYLHTVYSAYLEDTFSGAGKKPSFLDWSKTKKLDDPRFKQFKDSVLVEAVDPAIVLSETVGLIGRDTAILVMFKNIREVSRKSLAKYLAAQAVARTKGEGIVSPDTRPIMWTFEDPFLTEDNNINLIEIGRKDLADLLGASEVSVKWISEQLDRAQTASATTGKPLDPKVVELATLRDTVLQNRLQGLLDWIKVQSKARGLDDTVLDETFGSKETGYNVRAIQEYLLGEGYKKVPNSKRWGAMAGQYMKEELYNDLSRTFAIFDDENANKWFGRGGYLEQFTSEWKKLKVPFNIPSWFRNFVGTFIAVDMSTDTSTPQMLRMVIDHATNIVESQLLRKPGVQESIFITEAKKRGKFSTTFTAQEIRFNRNRWIQLQKRLEEAKREEEKMSGVKRAWWMLTTEYWKLSELVGDIYSNIEGGFKSVVMEDYVNHWIKTNGEKYGVKTLDDLIKLRDKSPEGAHVYETVFDAAGTKADKWVLDYSKIPNWLEYIRRMPLGAPFITWTYKMFPRTVEAMVKYPHKVAPYVLAPIILQQFSMAMFDWDDEDVKDFKKSLPDWLQSQSSMSILPWKHEGKVIAVPMGYYMPWSAYIDPVLKAANGFSKQPPGIGNALEKTGGLIQDFGILGGPVPSLLFDLLTKNKDSFTGQPIIDTEAPAAVQMNQLGLYLGNLMLPTWLGSQGMLGHILDNMGIQFPFISKGEAEDRWGVDKESIGQALARGVGVSSVAVNLARSKAQKLRTLRSNVAKAKAELTKVRKNMSLQGERRAGAIAKRSAVVKFHQERLRRFVSG